MEYVLKTKRTGGMGNPWRHREVDERVRFFTRFTSDSVRGPRTTPLSCTLLATSPLLALDAAAAEVEAC